MKKYAKENYINNFEDTILSSENSTKTFWQIMGRFMGKQAITNSIPPLYTSNNNYVFSDEEKANILNDFFCSISTMIQVHHYLYLMKEPIPRCQTY